MVEIWLILKLLQIKKDAHTAILSKVTEKTVKQRIIHKYGLLDEMEAKEPDILERLKKEAKAGLLSSNLTIQVTYDLFEPMNEPDKSYGWMVLDNLFEELKLHEFMKKVKSKSTDDLSTALKLLVFQRILNPNSKLATVKSQVALFGDWDIQLNAIYRYLDKLDEIKNDIQLHLHCEISRLTNREGCLVFFTM